jgi:pimeloyl-ACP methyl ester carboxylesterase
MPTVELGPATIHYETFGDGPPVLLLAPGGLRASRIETWANAPWSPIDALADRFQVVAMDQRNTGTSSAPITAADGWDSYEADQLGLMDHLGIDRFAVVGMCIGGAFIAKLLVDAPERLSAAVAMQPIGLDANRATFDDLFGAWRDGIAAEHPEADDAVWAAVQHNLFGRDDYLWSVPDAAIPAITAPLLVLRGNDEYHPSSASERLAVDAPNATLIARWKDADHVDAARTAVTDFLVANA